MDLLTQVLNRPKAPAVEIAFSPFFNQKAPFARARHLLEHLTKPPVVTVHLSYHNEPTAVVAANAQALSGFLDVCYSRATQLVISPSLEDEYGQKDFVQRCGLILSKLDRNKIDANRVRFRRNPVPYRAASAPAAIPIPAPPLLGGQTEIKTETEVHVNNLPSATAFSNDGQFVYLEGAEDPAKTANSEGLRSDDAVEKIPLGTFVKNTATSGNVVLLWRPAYNLFPKAKTRDGLFYYTKVGSPYERVDGRNSGFDKTEVTVLERFLGLTPPAAKSAAPRADRSRPAPTARLSPASAK